MSATAGDKFVPAHNVWHRQRARSALRYRPAAPTTLAKKDWNTKLELPAVRIHHYEKAFVDIALAAWGEELSGRAAEDIAERQPFRIVPVLGRRLLAQGSDPRNVFDPSLGKHLTAQKSWAGKRRGGGGGDGSDSGRTKPIPRPPADVLPVEPGNFVVLTIGIVVAALCPPDLIASQQHRHA